MMAVVCTIVIVKNISVFELSFNQLILKINMLKIQQGNCMTIITRLILVHALKSFMLYNHLNLMCQSLQKEPLLNSACISCAGIQDKSHNKYMYKNSWLEIKPEFVPIQDCTKLH